MTRILVLGATGYIGFPLCQSLRRAAYQVYGTVRSEAKVPLLKQNEIIPVLATIEGGEYATVIEEANIDIVIDAAGSGKGSWMVLEALQKISARRLERRGPHGPKLGFVYLSGTWVHGSSLQPVSDLNPVGVEGDAGCATAPPELVAWRPELERAVLESKDVLDSVIVRPGLLYGGASNLWSLWLGPIFSTVTSSTTSEEVHISAKSDACPGLIHVDDVVSAVHLAVGKHSWISTASGTYPVFDIVASSERLKPILEEAAVILGYNGRLVFDGPEGDAFAEAMSTSMRPVTSRARDLLGWVPKHVSMESGLPQFIEAWRAHQ